MATVHPLPVRADGAPPDAEGVLNRLARLISLELELGLAETRATFVAAAIAIAVAVTAAIAAVAAVVVLVVAAFAPLFDAPWEPFVIAGGGVLLLAVAAIAWSVYRLTHLTWPRETLRTLQENWQWLAVQLRSRLTWR
jgi:hypothetical protein